VGNALKFTEKAGEDSGVASMWPFRESLAPDLLIIYSSEDLQSKSMSTSKSMNKLRQGDFDSTKATPSLSPIRPRHPDETRVNLILEISDTGLGIRRSSRSVSLARSRSGGRARGIRWHRLGTHHYQAVSTEMMHG